MTESDTAVPLDVTVIENAKVVRERGSGKLYILIPFSPENVITNPHKLQQTPRLSEPLPTFEEDDEFIFERTLTELLYELSITADISGFYLIKAAVMLSETKKEYKQSLRYIYADLSQMYSTSQARVERDMRYAITVSYKRADLHCLTEVFGTCESAKKPANHTAIAAIHRAVHERIKNKIAE